MRNRKCHVSCPIADCLDLRRDIARRMRRSSVRLECGENSGIGCQDGGHRSRTTSAAGLEHGCATLLTPMSNSRHGRSKGDRVKATGGDNLSSGRDSRGPEKQRRQVNFRFEMYGAPSIRGVDTRFAEVAFHQAAIAEEAERADDRTPLSARCCRSVLRVQARLDRTGRKDRTGLLLRCNHPGIRPILCGDAGSDACHRLFDDNVLSRGDRSLGTGGDE